MKRSEFLLLFLSTTILVAIMKFSHISTIFNLIKFLWILIHFTLVVTLSVYFYKKSKKNGVIIFLVSFFITGTLGLLLFPSEEITRLFILEPAIFIYAIITTLIIIKLNYETELNKGFLFSLLNNIFVFTIILIISSIFIIYSIFIPLTNSLFIENIISPKETSKSEVIKDLIGKRDFLIISKTTINNPTPIYLSIPIEQTRYCLYIREGESYHPNPVHKGTAFHNIEDTWINIEGKKVKNLDFGTPRFFIEETNIIVKDAAITGYSYYQYTKKRPLVVRLKPFSSMIINQGAEFITIPTSGLSDVNIIEIVERGENKHPGGSYRCSEAKVLTSINLIK